MWGSIGVAAVAFFLIIFLRKLTTAKIEEANAKSLASLKEHFGEEKFNALLEQKRVYTDTYFEKLREENDEADRLFEEEEAKRLAKENQEEENAEFLEQNNLAVWIKKGDSVARTLKNLSRNPDKIQTMITNSKKFAKPLAAEKICKILSKEFL